MGHFWISLKERVVWITCGFGVDPRVLMSWVFAKRRSVGPAMNESEANEKLGAHEASDWLILLTLSPIFLSLF